MPFSEQIKNRVKKEAAFRCCRCQSISVEVHHVIPEECEGPSDFDNAAPLCPNCHASFGDNPQKRKEIRLMRDWWYEQAKKMFSNGDTLDELQKIHSKLEKIESKQTSDLNALKSELKAMANEMIDNITLGTASVTASGIVNASAASSASLSASQSPSPSPSPSYSPIATSSPLGDNVYANVRCHNCGTSIGLLIGSNVCPNCKAKLN